MKWGGGRENGAENANYFNIREEGAIAQPLISCPPSDESPRSSREIMSAKTITNYYPGERKILSRDHLFIGRGINYRLHYIPLH